MTECIAFRTGKLVYLRTLLKSLHAETALRWMNDPEVTKYLMRVYPMTAREEDEWMDSQGKDSKNVALAIHTLDEDKFIGTIGLHAIDLINRNAVTGTVIGDKDYQGKGYGTDAKMLLLDFAFNELDLDVIMSKVLAFNDRSLAYGKKCGYEECGRIPGWIRRQGKRHDEVILTVTQERWRPLWEEYKKDL
jgi:RimJ/RimL family protein N-acetyltransferase